LQHHNGKQIMALATTLTQFLRIEHPVMLAAMDVVADARLTMAVSEAGGFGVLGGGYGEETWLRQELDLLVEARRARGARFGVGFITWSLARKPELLDLVLAAKPDALWLSFGDPAPFAVAAKAVGVPLICQVQSVAMAQEALACGADIIVAQGAEAGGHGGARGTFALVPAVVDAVGQHAIVVAAGGVADGRGLASALMLGAQGVVLGTRLYASDEAAGHAEAKRRISAASGDKTIRSVIFDISRRNVWPAPFTGRCLLNDHARRWRGLELELLRNAQREGDAYMAARQAGNFDIAAVIAGEAVDLIKEVRPAGEIVRSVVSEAQALLAMHRVQATAACAAPVMKLKLFFNQTSPYARKVRVAAHELGIAQQIEWIEVDPWKEPDNLTTANPLSKVPALMCSDGRVVTESDTIIQTLADLVPGSALVPVEAHAASDARVRAALCQGLIDASFIAVIEGRRPAAQQWRDWVVRQERAVERALAHIESAFDLSDTRFDMGDIGLACALAYLDFRWPHLAWRERSPRTSIWFERVRLRPSMLATAPS
jgi:nitronate monooxygenase